MSGVGIYAIVMGCFTLIVIAFGTGYERGHAAAHRTWMRAMDRWK